MKHPCYTTLLTVKLSCLTDKDKKGAGLTINPRQQRAPFEYSDGLHWTMMMVMMGMEIEMITEMERMMVMMMMMIVYSGWSIYINICFTAPPIISTLPTIPGPFSMKHLTSHANLRVLHWRKAYDCDTSSWAPWAYKAVSSEPSYRSCGPETTRKTAFFWKSEGYFARWWNWWGSLVKDSQLYTYVSWNQRGIVTIGR